MTTPNALQTMLPCLQWLREYDRHLLTRDMLAAVIVTLMLIPQSLAYALLAGLPMQAGLFASMLPLVAYALFGSSRSLSVGPVAVIALMTASAIQPVVASGAMTGADAAILLALLSGVMLFLLGLLRVGFLANFLSHPVIAGFITASAIIIAVSQLRHLLGIDSSGDNLPELLHTLYTHIRDSRPATALLGFGTLAFLLLTRSGLRPLLKKTPLPDFVIGLLLKATPVFAVIVTTLIAWHYRLDQHGVALVGAIPSALPTLHIPVLSWSAIQPLLLSAALISVIGYVESVSVGRTLAARRQQKINADQELVGLGAANIAAALSGGFPVTGGFSRSVVNFDAGAETPAAGVFTAIGIAVVALWLTPLLAWLPHATLGATIIVAVLSLVDFAVLRRTWNYSRSDFIAVVTTMLVTLLWGVETGVSCGVAASLVLHLLKTSRPHIAEIGEIEGTGHFRNVKRHKVITHPAILSLRVDESLYFANASFIEDEIWRAVQLRPGLKHVVLLCAAVNEIDISALEVLEALNVRLQALGIGLHLSEVKGPVLDNLQKSDFLRHLNGEVFMTQRQACDTLEARERERLMAREDFHDFQI